MMELMELMEGYGRKGQSGSTILSAGTRMLSASLAGRHQLRPWMSCSRYALCLASLTSSAD